MSKNGLYQKIEDIIFYYRNNIFILVPFFMGIGIILFSFNLFINVVISLKLIIFLSIISYLLKKHNFIFLYSISLIMLFINIGIMSIYISHQNKDSNKISNTIYKIPLKGIVDDIEISDYRVVYTLKDLSISSYKELDIIDIMDKTNYLDINQNELPEKVRIKINNYPEIKVGDKIGGIFTLSEIGEMLYPNSYSFKHRAFFKEIGAIGYNNSEIKILSHNNISNFNQFLNKLRNSIINRIVSSVNNVSASGVIAALLVGEQSLIPKEDKENMRNSSLYHLISISGLHMVLVSGTIFVFIRFLFSCSQNLSYSVNSKKIASLMAILFVTLYLMISGFPIPAVRAFIMIILLFIAILIDREANATRTICLAAIIIMLIAPEEILFPSFQLSFAATMGLVFIYQLFYQHFKVEREISLLRKILNYFLTIIFSSIIASFATFPFVAYNFGTYSLYGQVANILAIPVATFWVMPAGLMSLVAMIVGLEDMPLYLMKHGVMVILEISEIVSKWTLDNGGILFFSDFSSWYIALFIVSSVWFLVWGLWEIRIYGLIGIFIAIILIFLFPKNPDLIIDGDREYFAINRNDADNKFLLFSNKIKSNFKLEIILNKLGYQIGNKNIYYSISEIPSNINLNLNCSNAKESKDWSSCVYKYKNYNILLLKDIDIKDDLCKNAHMIVNLSNFAEIDCDISNKKYIDKYLLKKCGTITIKIQNNKNIKFNSVNECNIDE